MTAKLSAVPEATGKAPPVVDIEAEGQVLGALLYDPRHVSAVPPTLKPESFYSEAHRQVFAAICALRDDGVEINHTNVAAHLRSKGRIHQLPCGDRYLVELIDCVPVVTPGTFLNLVGIVMARSAQRAAQLILARAIARFGDPSLSVFDALGDLEKEILSVSLGMHKVTGLKPIKDSLKNVIAEWGERTMGRGKPGTPTGFTDIDEETGGLHAGDLIILGARPGMGKTALVTGIAVNVAKQGEGVAIFSLEMPAEQLAGRMLCTDAGLRLSKTRAGALEPHELTLAVKSLHELKDLGIAIDDGKRGRPFVADIVAESRRYAAELARKGKRLSVVIVDYLQIVQLRDHIQKQRHDLAIGEVSIALKSLAKELDCCVIACSQLNRGVEQRPDKRPGMADIRDSGQIEQDADIIAMLYRDEYYNPQTKDPGIVEVLIAKSRNGRTGKKYLRFDGPTTRFMNLDAHDERRARDEDQ